MVLPRTETSSVADHPRTVLAAPMIAATSAPVPSDVVAQSKSWARHEVTLPGGSAAKAGVTSEALWTARILAQLLDDRVSVVHLEPPDGEGIEFTVETLSGEREHHQTKRPTGSRGWTVRSLAAEGVIAAIRRWTADGGRFVFVSSAPVADIPEIAAFAAKADTLDQFNSLLDGDRRDTFDQLRELLRQTPDAAWRTLSRVRFRHGDDDGLREHVEALLTPLVDAEPRKLVSRLIEYSLVQTNRRLTSNLLWSELKLRRRNWGGDPHLRAAVSRLRTRYLADVADEDIVGIQIDRTEVTHLAERLTDDGGPTRLLVVASAGKGKSVVLGQTVRALEVKGVLTLPFRLDQVELTVQPEPLGAGMGLPGSPAGVLVALAAGDRAVLVIDQLDAVSQVSGRDPQYLACIESMIRELEPFPNVRILLACRDFDLEADPRLRSLRALPGAQVVELQGFANNEVDRILPAMGLNPGALTQGQRDLLTTPLHLRLLADDPGTEFGTVLDLYERTGTQSRSQMQAAVRFWRSLRASSLSAVTITHDCDRPEPRAPGPGWG